MLDFERLDVYRVSLEIAERLDRCASRIRRTHLHLSDQIRRAGVSILLNGAEGAGEQSPGEKARFYRMALRSTTECIAALALIRRLGLLPAEELADLELLLRRCAQMLTRLIAVHRSP